VIDDSALMRQLLSQVIGSDSDMEVIGTAPDPLIAWQKIQQCSPDVLTLDVEMPRMDGITFLEKLMRIKPMPVVMVSTLTEKGCETTLRALELGAVDFVTKPKVDLRDGTMALADELIAKVKSAARIRPRPRTNAPRPAVAQGAKKEIPISSIIQTSHKVIAIGASTGGTEALREVLQSFPHDAPGTVITQHMPEKFTKAFADRLDTLCKIRVVEAVDGARILPGHAYIAPGNFHMEVVRSGANYMVKVRSGEAVNRHRPSVDVMFNSCAQALGRNCVGVILTGMGDDGARGMVAMRKAGARTIAQDEASCVVFGMPKEAIAMGGAEIVLPLHKIADETLRLAAPLGARV